MFQKPLLPLLLSFSFPLLLLLAHIHVDIFLSRFYHREGGSNPANHAPRCTEGGLESQVSGAKDPGQRTHQAHQAALKKRKIKIVLKNKTSEEIGCCMLLF